MDSQPVAVEYPAVRMAALRVTEMSPKRLTEWLDRACQAQGASPRTLGYVNAHVYNQCWKSAEVYSLLRTTDLVYADGASVGWAARLTGQPAIERTTAADWLPDVVRALAERGHSWYFLGGEDGVAETFARQVLPDAQDRVAGTHHGFLARVDPQDLVDQINATGAEILLVGMGTPWQEQFVLQYRSALKVRAIWWVGAGMDYFAGAQQRGPAWARAMGHEWLGRLLADPGRLAGRYLYGNPLFLWRIMMRRIPPDTPTGDTP